MSDTAGPSSPAVSVYGPQPCEELAVANPWTKKNPLLSLWLSGANAVAGKARTAGAAEVKRQQTSLVKQAARFWSGAQGRRPQPRGRPRARRRGPLLERRVAGRHQAHGQAEAPPLSPASPAGLRGGDTRHGRARPADQSERRWRAEADAAGTAFVRRSFRPLLRQAVRRYAPADAARRGTDRGAADRSETASTSSATSPGTAWWTMCPAPGTSRSSLPGISPWSRTACRPTSTTWSSVPATITTGIRRPR